jgi:putative addiction module component (TIGR02574 family)
MNTQGDIEMPTVADRVVDEVLELPSEVRVSLVNRILTSLNLPTQPEIDRLWAVEAERRIGQIDRGEVELIPGEVVFERIRRKYAT